MRTLNKWDAEKFIDAWMSSSTVKEVAQRLGRNPKDCSVFAASLRTKGVKLPVKRRAISVEALNARIASYANGKGVTP